MQLRFRPGWHLSPLSPFRLCFLFRLSRIESLYCQYLYQILVCHHKPTFSPLFRA
nr:MAG TPA: hypothetical protein [Caudoviricetes sp.]